MITKKYGETREAMDNVTYYGIVVVVVVVVVALCNIRSILNNN